MSETNQTRDFIQNYFDALNAGQVEDIPIAPNCGYHSSMLSESIYGAAAMREHLAAITPFVERFDVKKTIVDGSNGAVIIRLLGFGHKWIEGAAFFEVVHGQLTSLDNLFDTRQLLEKSGS